jgi:hypothetical protein
VCATPPSSLQTGKRKRHAQDSTRVLGLIAEPTRTDGLRCLCRQFSTSSKSPQVPFPGSSKLSFQKWYLAPVCGFALAYHIIGQLSIIPPDAFIYSLTSFHGRGFFPGLEHRTSSHDPLITLAAIKAVVGLFIEISFIATFTQRFFGR